MVKVCFFPMARIYNCLDGVFFDLFLQAAKCVFKSSNLSKIIILDKRAYLKTSVLLRNKMNGVLANMGEDVKVWNNLRDSIIRFVVLSSSRTRLYPLRAAT
jgi:hypothetical protein